MYNKLTITQMLISMKIKIILIQILTYSVLMLEVMIKMMDQKNQNKYHQLTTDSIQHMSWFKMFHQECISSQSLSAQNWRKNFSWLILKPMALRLTMTGTNQVDIRLKIYLAWSKCLTDLLVELWWQIKFASIEMRIFALKILIS